MYSVTSVITTTLDVCFTEMFAIVKSCNGKVGVKVQLLYREAQGSLNCVVIIIII